jgi:hypothetical protein
MRSLKGSRIGFRSFSRSIAFYGRPGGKLDYLANFQKSNESNVSDVNGGQGESSGHSGWLAGGHELQRGGARIFRLIEFCRTPGGKRVFSANFQKSNESDVSDVNGDQGESSGHSGWLAGSKGAPDSFRLIKFLSRTWRKTRLSRQLSKKQ